MEVAGNRERESGESRSDRVIERRLYGHTMGRRLFKFIM